MWKFDPSGLSVSQHPVLLTCPFSACLYDKLSRVDLFFEGEAWHCGWQISSGHRSRQVLQVSFIGNKADHFSCVDLDLSPQ